MLLTLMIMTAVAVGTETWVLRPRAPALLSDEPMETEPVEKLTDTIDIPKLGRIHLKADNPVQTLTFDNPPQNLAQFRISMLLEDGTVLWTSELIAPGETSVPVTLSRPLSAGEYENAILKYECFRVDDTLAPLNGAENRLTIEVK